MGTDGTYDTSDTHKSPPGFKRPPREIIKFYTHPVAPRTTVQPNTTSHGLAAVRNRSEWLALRPGRGPGASGSSGEGCTGRRKAWPAQSRHRQMAKTRPRNLARPPELRSADRASTLRSPSAARADNSADRIFDPWCWVRTESMSADSAARDNGGEMGDFLVLECATLVGRLGPSAKESLRAVGERVLDGSRRSAHRARVRCSMDPALASGRAVAQGGQDGFHSSHATSSWPLSDLRRWLAV